MANWKELSPEEYQERCASIRRGVRKYWDNLTPEKHEGRCVVNALRWTEEERRKASERSQEQWALMTVEEKLAHLEGSFHSAESRERFRKFHEGMTVEERKRWINRSFHGEGARKLALERMPEGLRNWWASMTPEQKAVELRKRIHSDEAQEASAEGLRRRWAGMSDEERESHLRSSFHSDEARINWSRSCKRPPSEPEILLGSYLDERFPGEWIYNGDGSAGVAIGGKIPDFVNVNGRKAVIEVFGDYWHDESEVEPLKAHYGRFGFDCVIIWEHECYVVEGIDSILGVLVDG